MHAAPNTILGIDPGTRYMGVVVLAGQELLSSGVHTLRNGERPHDVIGQAKRIVLGYVARFHPEIVAFEAPLPIASRRGAILAVVGQEFHARSRELGLEVRALPPHEVRQVLLGNPRATKFEIAHALVHMGFEELREKLPQKPARAALGFRPRDRYWLHLFDALAVALATRRRFSSLAQVRPEALQRVKSAGVDQRS
jgi:Holliday junction resolvasome RuvABC endonuclease subunit